MKRGKKYQDAVKKYDRTAMYDADKAMEILKQIAYAKFDETVEASFRLKIKKNHTVRDTLVFPNSFGKEKTILVFAKGDKAKEAKEAGAHFVGDDDIIEKVKNGWTDFDVCIATPDMMKDVGKLGPVLGRKGLMPNPKLGTVTQDIKGAINELKKGRVEFRADKAGVVHIAIGKISMDAKKLKENLVALYDEILRKKPNDLKGEYIGSLFVSTTMSPAVKINTKTIG